MMPLSNDIEVPLLEALIEIGGEGTPRAVCPLVTKRFPKLTESELAETYKRGESKLIGRIHVSRFTLTQKGEIDNSRYGIWAITEKGRKRVRVRSLDALKIKKGDTVVIENINNIVDAIIENRELIQEHAKHPKIFFAEDDKKT